jgi:hypothetical protein
VSSSIMGIEDRCELALYERFLGVLERYPTGKGAKGMDYVLTRICSPFGSSL